MSGRRWDDESWKQPDGPRRVATILNKEDDGVQQEA